MTLLAKYIKKRREKLKISQMTLGEYLGFENGQFISNIENSENIQYPPKYFKKISRMLNINIVDMCELAIKDLNIWLLKEIKSGK